MIYKIPAKPTNTNHQKGGAERIPSLHETSPELDTSPRPGLTRKDEITLHMLDAEETGFQVIYI